MLPSRPVSAPIVSVDSGFIELFVSGPAGWLGAGLWGAIWGSFFNVLIVRAPGRESLVRPASHCRSCKALIPWYDNIPLVSYVLLRGRCRRCGARYSPQYFIVELLVTVLVLLMYFTFVTADSVASVPVGLRLARFVITSLFVGVLVALTFIDLETMRIPDVITYPAIPVFVGLSLFMAHPHWWDGLAGAVGGYLLIRLVADGYRLLTGRTGMGYGDAKLLSLIGALMGWQVLLPVLFLASLQGTVIGVSLLVIVRAARKTAPGDVSHEAPKPDRPAAVSDEEADADADDDDDEDLPDSLRFARLPFGPYLSLAAVETLLLSDFLRPFFPYFYS